mmetsp:Transcript_21537/g.41105  ORF Transcript_21537/g.41105 Transcript_21537/m.41105 type:complete len:391 (-) Transcript_21537:85-1257(-)
MEHGNDEDPPGRTGLPPEYPTPAASTFSDMDAELAAAIEASYRTQGPGGVEQSEDQLIAQAMQMSRLEEVERRRRVGEDLGEFEDAASAFSSEVVGGSSAAAYNPVSPLIGAAGSATGSASSSAGPAPQRSAGTNRMQSAIPRGIEEEGDGSDAAVAGGSSRASSPPGSTDLAGLPRHTAGGAHRTDEDDIHDPQLAAAIEASYVAQTEHGMECNEEDMIQEALRISQQEEESRQRAALREQQEVELQESILMDQMREQEEKRRRLEEEQLRELEASRVADDERRRIEEQETKRARIPPEPDANEPGRIDLQIRMPDGRRRRRAFRPTDLIGQVYDYIDVEPANGEASVAQAGYRLVSTMPRREYEDRKQSLGDAGLQGQCALLVEQIQA